jgi:uncharacterized membrane protein
MKYDLLYIIAFSLLLAGLITLDSRWLALRFAASTPWHEVISLGSSGLAQYLRVILGLPLILFFPGYVLMAAIFPRKGEFRGIERMAFSFGLSIVVTPLIGFGLNFTPWGIKLAPILISLIAFIILFSALALYQRRKLPAEDVYVPGFDYELPVIKEMSRLDKALSVLLVLAILSTFGMIGYVRAFPKVEQFTEFYILGPDGKMGGYPTALTVGRQAQVTVVVVNHEQAAVNYFVQVKTGDYLQSTIQPIVLNNRQELEKPVVFAFYAPHDSAEVQFLLFRQGDTTPYRSLHIWVNVKAPPAPSVAKPVKARQRRVRR